MDEAIILAGGLGTRLRSEVPDIPKVLAPVAGRPFVAYLLDQLARQKFSRVILATGYHADQVEAALGIRWRHLTLEYSREHEPLGTGGAIREALGLCQSEYIAVVNGDTYLEIDYGKLEADLREQEARIAIALAHVDNAERYSRIVLNGDRVVGFKDNGFSGPAWIHAGAYGLGRDILHELPETTSFSFERGYMEAAAKRGEVIGFKDTNCFIDIGIPEDYRRAQSLFDSSGWVRDHTSIL